MTRRPAYKPTLGLRAFIESANQLEHLPDLTVNTASFLNDPGTRKLLRSLGNFQREYLKTSIDKLQFSERYDALKQAQKALPSLVPEEITSRSDYEPGDGVMAFAKVDIPVAFYYRKNGRISASGEFFSEIEMMPPGRLLHCAECEKLFFATRSNSPCCSLRCRKRRNKRNSRNAHKTHKAMKANQNRRARQ